MRRRPSRIDPAAVGRSECAAWVGYYRRDWSSVLRGALGMVRWGFDLGLVGNFRGAWHVLRANQAWAPFPGNDPDAARRSMARFYRLTDRAGRLEVDPVRAAALEVDWWRVHREHQHDDQVGADRLVEALAALYAYVYHVEPARVRPAAAHRVAAMDLSDAWVADGRSLDAPSLAEQRRLLVTSYEELARL